MFSDFDFTNVPKDSLCHIRIFRCFLPHPFAISCKNNGVLSKSHYPAAPDLTGPVPTSSQGEVLWIFVAVRQRLSFLDLNGEPTSGDISLCLEIRAATRLVL